MLHVRRQKRMKTRRKFYCGHWNVGVMKKLELQELALENNIELKKNNIKTVKQLRNFLINELRKKRKQKLKENKQKENTNNNKEKNQNKNHNQNKNNLKSIYNQNKLHCSYCKNQQKKIIGRCFTCKSAFYCSKNVKVMIGPDIIHNVNVYKIDIKIYVIKNVLCVEADTYHLYVHNVKQLVIVPLIVDEEIYCCIKTKYVPF